MNLINIILFFISILVIFIIIYLVINKNKTPIISTSSSINVDINSLTNKIKNIEKLLSDIDNKIETLDSTTLNNELNSLKDQLNSLELPENFNNIVLQEELDDALNDFEKKLKKQMYKEKLTVIEDILITIYQYIENNMVTHFLNNDDMMQKVTTNFGSIFLNISEYINDIDNITDNETYITSVNNIYKDFINAIDSLINDIVEISNNKYQQDKDDMNENIDLAINKIKNIERLIKDIVTIAQQNNETNITMLNGEINDLKDKVNSLLENSDNIVLQEDLNTVLDNSEKNFKKQMYKEKLKILYNNIENIYSLFEGVLFSLLDNALPFSIGDSMIGNPDAFNTIIFNFDEIKVVINKAIDNIDNINDEDEYILLFNEIYDNVITNTKDFIILFMEIHDIKDKRDKDNINTNITGITKSFNKINLNFILFIQKILNLIPPLQHIGVNIDEDFYNTLVHGDPEDINIISYGILSMMFDALSDIFSEFISINEKHIDYISYKNNIMLIKDIINLSKQHFNKLNIDDYITQIDEFDINKEEYHNLIKSDKYEENIQALNELIKDYFSYFIYQLSHEQRLSYYFTLDNVKVNILSKFDGIKFILKNLEDNEFVKTLTEDIEYIEVSLDHAERHYNKFVGNIDNNQIVNDYIFLTSSSESIFESYKYLDDAQNRLYIIFLKMIDNNFIKIQECVDGKIDDLKKYIDDNINLISTGNPSINVDDINDKLNNNLIPDVALLKTNVSNIQTNIDNTISPKLSIAEQNIETNKTNLTTRMDNINTTLNVKINVEIEKLLELIHGICYTIPYDNIAQLIIFIKKLENSVDNIYNQNNIISLLPIVNQEKYLNDISLLNNDIKDFIDYYNDFNKLTDIDVYSINSLYVDVYNNIMHAIIIINSISIDINNYLLEKIKDIEKDSKDIFDVIEDINNNNDDNNIINIENMIKNLDSNHDILSELNYVNGVINLLSPEVSNGYLTVTLNEINSDLISFKDDLIKIKSGELNINDFIKNNLELIGINNSKIQKLNIDMNTYINNYLLGKISNLNGQIDSHNDKLNNNDDNNKINIDNIIKNLDSNYDTLSKLNLNNDIVNLLPTEFKNEYLTVTLNEIDLDLSLIRSEFNKVNSGELNINDFITNNLEVIGINNSKLQTLNANINTHIDNYLLERINSLNDSKINKNDDNIYHSIHWILNYIVKFYDRMAWYEYSSKIYKEFFDDSTKNNLKNKINNIANELYNDDLNVYSYISWAPNYSFKMKFIKYNIDKIIPIINTCMDNIISIEFLMSNAIDNVLLNIVDNNLSIINSRREDIEINFGKKVADTYQHKLYYKVGISDTNDVKISTDNLPTQLLPELKSNRKFIVENNNYIFKERLYIKNLENIEIDFNYSTIIRDYTTHVYDGTIHLEDCKNVTIKNLLINNKRLYEGVIVNNLADVLIVVDTSENIVIRDAILFNSNVGLFVRSSHYVKIKNVRIEDIRDHNIAVSKLNNEYPNSSNILIENCYITKNDRRHGIIVEYASDVRCINNIIDYCYSGIKYADVTNFFIKGNSISDYSGYGVELINGYLGVISDNNIIQQDKTSMLIKNSDMISVNSNNTLNVIYEDSTNIKDPDNILKEPDEGVKQFDDIIDKNYDLLIYNLHHALYNIIYNYYTIDDYRDVSVIYKTHLNSDIRNSINIIMSRVRSELNFYFNQFGYLNVTNGLVDVRIELPFIKNNVDKIIQAIQRCSLLIKQIRSLLSIEKETAIINYRN